MKKCLLGMAVFLFLLPLNGGSGKEETVKEDFSGGSPGKDWKVSAESWKVAEGELRGKGDGFLGFTKTLSGDFLLKFDAQTEEKANLEVTLLDKTGKKRFTPSLSWGSTTRSSMARSRLSSNTTGL